MVLESLKRFAESSAKKAHGDSHAAGETTQPAAKVDASQLQQRPEEGTQLEIPRIDVQTGLTAEPRPLLDDADERFLNEAASEFEPQLQSRGSITITDDGEVIEHDAGPGTESPPPGEVGAGKANAAAEGKKRKFRYWSFVPQAASDKILSTVPKMTAMTDISSWRPSSRGKDQVATADGLMAAANSVKASSAAEHGAPVDDEEAKKEQRDISAMLSNLNLSSINNRVFSISKDSQVLLQRFNLVLKDIVTGAPTAYHDLEKLLTERNTQIEKLYDKMPPFIQTLVKSLPTKMMSAYAPALMATAGASAEASSASDSKKKKSKTMAFIPSLKSLVLEKGAIMTMLQSILQFLRLRFPAVLAGTNVLMSLALFILLFILWYCHKRGKEVRLADEAQNTPADADTDADADPIAIPVTPLPLASDAATLEALETRTSLADSQRHSTVLAAAARATLPDGVPLPRADTGEWGALGK